MSRSILAEIAWDDCFAIPVANAENKALEDELKRKQKEKINMDNQVKDFEERIHAMSAHLKNVRQELSYTQVLCRAREKETETEEHFKILADREVGRLQQEIQRLENELVTLRERKNTQENNIFKANQKLEDLKCKLNWDQQALECWLEESARKDEDSAAIQKYALKDDGKIKALSLKIEKMTTEASQKRKLLDNELTETITAQVELDKAAETFRRAHQERQQLIRQWESTIQQMQKRDEEIDHYALLLAQVKQEIREKEILVNERIQFLKSEVDNNAEFEKKISIKERLAAKLRIDYREQEASRNRLQEELDTLKATVDRTGNDLESIRIQVSNLKKEIQDKKKRVIVVKEQNEALSDKLKCVNNSTLTTEEKAKQIDEMLTEEEQYLKEFEVQLKQLRDQHFKKTEELHTQNAKEKNLIAEISGSRAALRNRNSFLRKLDGNALKQQEIIYSQDFQIQQLERRLSRLKGETNNEEKHILEAKVSELSKICGDKRSELNILNIQHKKLQCDVANGRRELEKIANEKGNLVSKIEELTLFNTMSDKELKRTRVAKQDLMVDENILKLEIKRLRDMVFNKADHVYSLEKRRLQLQNAMKERTEEIGVHKEMLKAQLRLVEQERQSISVELQDRLAKIDKMRKRYEVVTISMMPPEGEEEKSQAYYIIKAAQEKEELQCEGDELDAKIRKAEKEIRALENTLQVINSCNSTYKKSFQKVTETSEEYEDKIKLEEQKRAAEEKYRYKRRQIKELQEDIQTMKNTLDCLLKDEASYQATIDEKISYSTQLNKETEEQNQKLERVMKQCSKLIRHIRSAKKTKGETQEEKDIALRDLREFNRSINKMLVEAMEVNPDLNAALQLYFQQFCIDLPTIMSTPSSRRSSAPSSVRSSLSSERSSTSRSTSSSISSQSSVKVVDIGLPFVCPPTGSSSSSSQGSRSSSIAGSSTSSSARRKSQK
ncbi:coiled-coil domain-containing protein 39 [Ambystoma mexicanum]|uniref:coiled-coil domain-containing protein 39 n=1 Tax=Ambystoma mexicanum TaxID=8296 RepID=UPI0037E8FCEF